MNFKKSYISFALCAVLTFPLFSAVQADGPEYPALEEAEQGYEYLIPSYDGTLCIARQNGKYGLINANGEVLVDFLYDSYAHAPNLQGYTIFYRENITESLSYDGFDCAEWLRYNDDGTATCSMDSFLYDRNGNLVYSLPNTFFQSVSNNVLEVRDYKLYIPDAGISTFSYTLKYYEVHDFSNAIAQYENVIGSSAFSELYAAIVTITPEKSELYDDSEEVNCAMSPYTFDPQEERLHIINKNGTEIYNKSFFEISYDKMDLLRNGFLQEFDTIDLQNSSMFGSSILLPIGNTAVNMTYIYSYMDFESGEVTKMFPDTYAVPAFFNQNTSSVIHRNRILRKTWDETGTVLLCTFPSMNVLAQYPVISGRASSQLLVKNNNNEWGYIDLSGNEKSFYKDAADFINGRALVMDEQDRVFVINENFERISDYLTDVTGVNGTAVRKSDGLLHLIKNFGTINDKTGDEKRFILAVGDTRAKVWGQYLYNDVSPIIANNRTMLPARFVAENLGAEVDWNTENQCVTIRNANHSIELYIGSNSAKADGKEVTLDSAPFVKNNRTYCPVRFICESLGATVEWRAQTEEVAISLS